MFLLPAAGTLSTPIPTFLLTVARHLQMAVGYYKVHNSISFVADGFKTFSSQ